LKDLAIEVVRAFKLCYGAWLGDNDYVDDSHSKSISDELYVVENCGMVAARLGGSTGLELVSYREAC